MKTFLKSAQNQSLSSKICSGSSHEIGRSFENSCEISHFFREFVPENPTKFDFFPATYQMPCFNQSLWIVLKYTDCCHLKLEATLCLCSVILVNPSTPGSRWCHLLKLEQKKYFYYKAVPQFTETG